MTDDEVVQIATKAVNGVLDLYAPTYERAADGSFQGRSVAYDLRNNIGPQIIGDVRRALGAAKLSGGACEPLRSVVEPFFDKWFRLTGSGIRQRWERIPPEECAAFINGIRAALDATPPAEPAVVPERHLTSEEQGIFNRALLDSVTVVEPAAAPDDLVERLTTQRLFTYGPWGASHDTPWTYTATDVGTEAAARITDLQAEVERLPRVAAILRHLVRVFDAGGESLGRSMRSGLAEEAFQMLDRDDPAYRAEYDKCEADPIEYMMVQRRERYAADA